MTYTERHEDSHTYTRATAREHTLMHMHPHTHVHTLTLTHTHAHAHTTSMIHLLLLMIVYWCSQTSRLPVCVCLSLKWFMLNSSIYSFIHSVLLWTRRSVEANTIQILYNSSIIILSWQLFYKCSNIQIIQTSFHSKQLFLVA